MSVIEKFATISATITKLIDFVASDESVKDDFNDYLTSISAQNMTQSQVQAMLIPYIFERRLTEDSKSIIDIYMAKNKKIDKVDKSVLVALSTSFSSVFEIKKVMQTGFKLYNLVNEKTYDVISLVKMTNYRGVYSGQYAFCRIFKFEKEYYILEVSNILSPSQKEEVERFAIAKIIENPENIYTDNPEKLAEIESQVKSLVVKFNECFGSDEVITTNKYADNIINIFNNYTEDGAVCDRAEIERNIEEVEQYKFFNVGEFSNSYSNFVEKSLGGFSSHKSLYDVGIIFDKQLGLFAIPFYATFCKIFEIKDYKKIEGYEACVKSFLENDRIPHSIIERVAAKSPDFTARVNEILDQNYTYDELIKHYKASSHKVKMFSPTSVLYASKVFSEVMGFVVEKQEAPVVQNLEVVGRNEPCPCGSGKKYKKCCAK